MFPAFRSAILLHDSHFPLSVSRFPAFCVMSLIRKKGKETILEKKKETFPGQMIESSEKRWGEENVAGQKCKKR